MYVSMNVFIYIMILPSILYSKLTVHNATYRLKEKLTLTETSVNH